MVSEPGGWPSWADAGLRTVSAPGAPSAGRRASRTARKPGGDDLRLWSRLRARVGRRRPVLAAEAAEEGAWSGGRPQVRGLQLEALLGVGAHGEVWRAVRLGDGTEVAVKIARHGPRGPAARERLERELAFLVGCRHPHLVPLLGRPPLPGGGVALEMPLMAGGSLADLVRRRGPLPPGEVITLLVPLAQCLADLHRGGLTHADVAPGNVLLDATGKPFLADLGLAQALGASGPGGGTPGFADPDQPGPGPAGDVRALAAVAWYALTGAAPGPLDRPVRRSPESGAPLDAPSVRERLVAALLPALAADPDERPGPGDLAASVWSCGQAEPIRVAAGGSMPSVADAGPLPAELRSSAGAGPAGATGRVRPTRRAGRPAGRRPRRALAGGVVGALVVGLVALLGWLLLPPHDGQGQAPAAVAAAAPNASGAAGQDAGTTVAPTASGAVGEDPFASVLRALTVRRAQAITAGDTRLLDGVDEPGSAAWRADDQLIEQLRDAGLQVADLRIQLQQVSTLQQGPGSALVRVASRTDAYRQVLATGSAGSAPARASPGPAVAATVPQSRSSTVRVRLVQTAAGWRVREVLAG